MTAGYVKPKSISCFLGSEVANRWEALFPINIILIEIHVSDKHERFSSAVVVWLGNNHTVVLECFLHFSILHRCYFKSSGKVPKAKFLTLENERGEKSRGKYGDFQRAGKAILSPGDQ